jgi:hypothetical protein
MKKILTTIILASMLCAMVSCADGGKSNEAGGDTTLPSDAGSGTEIRENVPEKDYDGRVFRILCDEGTLAKDDFIAEQLNGEILNDSVYNRNSVMEQRFDIKLEPKLFGYGEGFVKNLDTMILAGEDACEAAMGMNNVFSGITSLVYEKRFIDWNELTYVDLEKPWWDSNVIRDLCFGDKIYCMTGDFNPSTLGNTRIILFNKNLFTDLGIEFPYASVLEGTWVYEDFLKISAQGIYDLNGDGKMKYTDDRYGYTGWYCDTSESIFYGLGGSYTIKGSNNLPEFNLNNEFTFNIVDKLIAVFAEENGGWLNTINWGIDMEIFAESRSLMLNSRFMLLSNFRDMKDDFGIIPHPKLNAEQKSYLESVDAVCTMCYIPITSKDLEYISIILEAMAAESYRTVMPAYYDVVLTTKLTRDNDSEGMIDIIKNSRSYPLQLKTFTFNLFTPFVTGQKNNMASFYKSNEKRGMEELKIIAEAYSS